jgi:ABC-type Fe3+-citrate transport system substrate-binding protein
VSAGRVTEYAAPGGGAKRDAERIVPECSLRVAAAAAAAIGNVPVGFVVDDFSLKKIADEFVGEIAEFVGTRRQVDRENVSVLVRNGVRG